MQLVYSFSALMWRHPGGWFFLSLPTKLSAEIREQLCWQEQGWGRMPARARIALLEWDTSIWYDSTLKCYLLPVKAVIRREAKLLPGHPVEIHLSL